MARFRFSLAAMLRFQAIVCFFAAWPVAVASVPPELVMGGITALGAILSIIVGARRRGTSARRAYVTAAFFAGGILVAKYSELAAVVVQWPAPPEGAHAWQSLDVLPDVLVLVIGLPVVLWIMLLMLQEWTWSAHDAADDAIA